MDYPWFDMEPLAVMLFLMDESLLSTTTLPAAI
jgi:hypothetical protein